MARRLTKEAIRRLLTRGLTGWEAGKLILQGTVDRCLNRNSVLTEADMASIRRTPMEGADVRDYNMFMALCRGFHTGQKMGEWACTDACLEIILLERPLRDAGKRRTVELFELCGPCVVTRKQYEDIVAAQKEKKLEFEYNLAYVIEERFYATAPPEAREEIDELCIDIESAEDFASAVPKKYTTVFKQAIDKIRRLCTSGKLPAVCHKEDAKSGSAYIPENRGEDLQFSDPLHQPIFELPAMEASSNNWFRR